MPLLMWRHWGVFFVLQVISDTALAHVKQVFMDAFDENMDERIEISEVWIGRQITSLKTNSCHDGNIVVASGIIDCRFSQWIQSCHSWFHYDDVTWTPCSLKSPVIRLFIYQLMRTQIKETSNSALPALCKGNSPVTDEFPSKRASNTTRASIWWRHHVQWCRP